MKPEIHVVHLAPSISPYVGGISESVRHLSRSVREAGAQVHVIALRDNWDEEIAKEWADFKTRTYSFVGPSFFGYSPGLKHALVSSHFDVLHLHGLWKYPSIAALNWAKYTNRPLIVSPHGMLEPWALAQSQLRKWVAMRIYQKECLNRARCIRATSHMELQSIRSAGLKNPVAIIPNGVDLPVVPRLHSVPAVNERRTALFLSRIHPKKGLLDLVEAWARVSPRDWRLLIVGPDESGHGAELQKAVVRHELQEDVQYLPGSFGSDRWQHFYNADLFVLPSYSENFGLVIAEALACGIPVITTRATPWGELEQERCGWWIDTGVQALTAALRVALSTPRQLLREMGLRGKKLVRSRYLWTPIGQMMKETMEWALQKRPAPPYVHFY